MEAGLFFATLSAVVLGGPMMASVGERIMRKRAEKNPHRAGKVRWFSRPANHPAIYILRSAEDPSLFKVGYTSRRVQSRAAEIATHRGGVQIVGWVTMPHAYAAEQRIHRVLPGKRGVRSMGNEWYRVSLSGAEKEIVDFVQKQARTVRTIAILRMSWPTGGKVRWVQAA